MGQGSTVIAPDGTRWRVRRRWLERPLPDLKRRFKTNRKQAVEGIEVFPVDGIEGIDSPAALIAGVVVVALIVLVVLPLLGVALELIGVLILLGSGLLGRVLLGRPWIVEAVKVGDPEERAAYAVRGWGQSSEALRQLRTAVAAGGRPDIAVGRRLSTRPAIRAD
jgi:hypothetical protein